MSHVQSIDDDGWIDYSFHLKASFALAVLKDAGVLPADAIVMNKSDQPLSYDGE